jgi:hypothetical protein
VHVVVDEAGHDALAGPIDDVGAGRHHQVALDRDDAVAGDEQIGHAAILGSEDARALDQQRTDPQPA